MANEQMQKIVQFGNVETKSLPPTPAPHNVAFIPQHSSGGGGNTTAIPIVAPLAPQAPSPQQAPPSTQK